MTGGQYTDSVENWEQHGEVLAVIFWCPTCRFQAANHCYERGHRPVQGRLWKMIGIENVEGGDSR